MSIKIENVEIVGWEPAIRGMRNALESWDKIDSYWTHVEDPETLQTAKFEFFIGENDLALMKKLSEAGNDHAKFMRFIDVTCDITAPLYLWKEFDTYRVGVEKNSCSTMHKIHAKEFTLDDFSHEQLSTDNMRRLGCCSVDILENTIEALNINRKEFIAAKKRKEAEQVVKLYWWQMIQLLPTSYNQRRTVKISYQALKNMYHARKNHKLKEWRDFCAWIRTLPYSELITGEKKENKE